MRLFESPAARRSALLRGTALLVAAAVLALLLHERLDLLTDAAALRAWVDGFGPYAPLAFVALQTGQVILAPIPGGVLGFVAGYLFGGVLGSVYSVFGVAIGSTIAIGLARRFGRPYVERVVAGDTLGRLDGYVAGRGQVGLFVLFLFPLFPDDALCFVAGLTDVPFRRVVAIVVAARAPTYALVAVAGGQLADARLVGAGLLLAVLALVGALGYWKRDVLLRAV